MLGGISPMQHANFIQFISKLDAAIVSQQQDLALRNSGADLTRKELAESERKRLTFDILDRRQVIALEKKQTRLEQKVTDEQASRLSALARHIGNT
jgi:flagellar FliJ protein